MYMSTFFAIVNPSYAKDGCFLFLKDESMIYKHNLFIAHAVDAFLKVMSNPILIDKAIMEREALTLNTLSHLLSVGNDTKKTVTISLSGAKVLGVVTPEGSFKNGVNVLEQHEFELDEERICRSEVLDGINLSDVEKLILDSVTFSVAFQLQNSKEYNQISINLEQIANHDIELYTLLNHDFNSHFHTMLLGIVSDSLEFADDHLTLSSIEKICELRNAYLGQAQIEKGIHIKDEYFIVPRRRSSSTESRLSDEKILEHQYDWLSIFALELPTDPESKAEYNAKVELLTIRQELLEESVKGKWQVGWQLSPHWLTLGEGMNDYQWLPHRVNQILTIIKQTFFTEEKPTDCYRAALKQVNDIIENYQPTYWSSGASIAFFQKQQLRLNMKIEELDELSLNYE